MQSGKIVFELFPEDVETMVGSIEMAIMGRRGDRALENPFAPILPYGEESGAYQDVQ